MGGPGKAEDAIGLAGIDGRALPGMMGEPFDGIPVTIPRAYDDKKRCWSVSGSTARLPARSAICEMRTYKSDEMLMWMHDMAEQVFGQCELGPMAPSRALLRKFGGDMDIDAFRARGFGAIHCVQGNLISYPQLTDTGTTNKIRGLRRVKTAAPQDTSRMGLGKGEYAKYVNEGKGGDESKEEATAEPPRPRRRAAKKDSDAVPRATRSRTRGVIEKQTTLADLLAKP